MANISEITAEDLLSFQDYPIVHNPTISSNNAQLNVNQENIEQKSNISLDDESNIQKNFWTIEYYQKFFNVDTQEVIDRIIASISPRRNNSLQYYIQAKPDLYGPFWITITLIFTIAISGNIANYFQHSIHLQHYHWKYDFHLVSYAATAIYCYIVLVPFALWSILKWSIHLNDLDSLESNNTNIGPLEIICVYGYSLFIYIPVSILWTIQIDFLQWLLVIVAACISGLVLIYTLMPTLRLSKYKIYLINGIVFCHFLLAVGFMLYFFHVPKSVASSIIPPTEAPTIKPIHHNNITRHV